MGAALRIGRLSTEYYIPSACPDPTRVRDRLGDGLERYLTEALGSMLGHRLGIGSEVWLVPRLEVQVDVGAHWDAERLGRALAEAIARALSRQLRTEDEQTVHFPDQAAHLARFLLDLSRGQAWGRWYYRAYQGLRMLPVSAALRSALCTPGAPTVQALLALTDPERETVLNALNEQDARWVLEALGEVSAAGPADVLAALWEVWQRRALVELGSEFRWRSALGLVVAAAGTSPAGKVSVPAGLALAVTGPGVVPAGELCVPGALALALLSFAALIATAPPERARRVVAVLLHSDPSAVFLEAGAAEAERLQPLRGIPADRLRPVLKGLLSRHGHAASAKDSSATELSTKKRVLRKPGLMEGSEPRHTPFGGLLVLLPFLDALPVPRITHDWPGVQPVAAGGLLRFLLLIRCAGRGRALAAFSDPLLRDLMGMPPGISAAEVGDWQGSLGARQLNDLLTGLADHRRRRGDTDESKLFLLPLRPRNGPVAVLIEARRGTWLDVRDHGVTNSLLDALNPWLAHKARVLTAGPLVDGLVQAFPSLPVRDYQTTEDAEERSEALAQLDRATEDLDYLRLPVPLGGARDVELALSVAAQGLMRDLAWRLAGFARSSLPYLYTNFLDFRASLEVQPDKYLVRLGRPPINVVLAMTGLARGSYRITGLDRPLVLFQGD